MQKLYTTEAPRPERCNVRKINHSVHLGLFGSENFEAVRILPRVDQASLTSAISVVSEALASPKSMDVLGL